MHGVLNHVYAIVYFRSIFLLMGLLSFHIAGFSDESLYSKIDCSDVTIDYEDDLELTDEERLIAMEEAFLESVNRFDLCNLASSSGEQVGEESEQDLAAGGAVANTMLEGTEEEESGSESPPLPPTQSGTGVMEERDGRVAKQDKGVRFWRQKENGKIPEDIPSADNDDVVAEQIRLAATIEKDADKKRKLWNEYRRYQGLPIKEDAE